MKHPDLKPIISETLGTAQILAIRSLVDRCNQHDGAALSFPFDDTGLFLYYQAGCQDGGQSVSADGFTVPTATPAVPVTGSAVPAAAPVVPATGSAVPAAAPVVPAVGLTIPAAMALVPCGDGAYECAAFTDPDFRGQGLFDRLLREGLSRIGEGAKLYFYTDAACLSSLAVLRKLGAELLGTEHMMELPAELLTPDRFPVAEPVSSDTACPLDKRPASSDAACPSGKKTASSVTSCLPGKKTASLTVNETMTGQEPALCYRTAFGRLFILAHPDSYFLSGLEIRKNRRGQGRGTELVGLTLADLARRGAKPVRLHVSGDNEPALALYKKAGFRITETLCSYEY